MITILCKATNKSAVIGRNRPDSGSWVNVVSPDEAERKKLEEEFHVPHNFVSAGLDWNERPRVDHEKGWHLVIVRAPRQNPETDDFFTIPIAVILNRSKLFTIYPEKNEIMRDFVTNVAPVYCTTRKFNFLLKVIRHCQRYFDQHVNHINDEINKVEKKLLSSQKNEEVLYFLKLQKSLVYFNTAVVGNGKVLEKLKSPVGLSAVAQEDKDLLDDIVIENKELIDTLTIFNNILSNTMDAYASIISNNLNIVMKFLTSFTIILSIPTIIFSLYGMNVPLPFQHHWSAVFLTLIASALIMLVLALLFNRKKFF